MVPMRLRIAYLRARKPSRKSVNDAITMAITRNLMSFHRKSNANGKRKKDKIFGIVIILKYYANLLLLASCFFIPFSPMVACENKDDSDDDADNHQVIGFDVVDDNLVVLTKLVANRE